MVELQVTACAGEQRVRHRSRFAVGCSPEAILSVSSELSPARTAGSPRERYEYLAKLDRPLFISLVARRWNPLSLCRDEASLLFLQWDKFVRVWSRCRMWS